jgi:hypothetical protein
VSSQFRLIDVAKYSVNTYETEITDVLRGTCRKCIPSVPQVPAAVGLIQRVINIAKSMEFTGCCSVPAHYFSYSICHNYRPTLYIYNAFQYVYSAENIPAVGYCARGRAIQSVAHIPDRQFLNKV